VYNFSDVTCKVLLRLLSTEVTCLCLVLCVCKNCNAVNITHLAPGYDQGFIITPGLQYRGYATGAPGVASIVCPETFSESD